MGKYPPFGRLLLFNQGRQGPAVVIGRVCDGMEKTMLGLTDLKMVRLECIK
jgi:hypothetical protein